MLPIYDVHSVQNRLQNGNRPGHNTSDRQGRPDFAKVLRAEILRVSELGSADGGGERRPFAVVEGALIGRDSSVRLDEIARATESATARLGDQLLEAFGEAGVDLDREIVLVAAPSGRARVANGHPDSARVEAVLSSRPDIANEVAFIASGVGLLRAVNEHRAFADLYELDPSAAAARQAKTDVLLTQERLHISVDDGAVRVFLAPEPIRFDRARSSERRTA